LVGLNWKFDRVVVAFTSWISSGIPSNCVGIASGVPGGLLTIVSADVNGDGQLDLIVVNDLDNDVSVFLNQG